MKKIFLQGAHLQPHTHTPTSKKLKPGRQRVFVSSTIATVAAVAASAAVSITSVPRAPCQRAPTTAHAGLAASASLPARAAIAAADVDGDETTAGQPDAHLVCQ